MKTQSRYVPAAGRSQLTGSYDTLIALTMRERRWRDQLVSRICASLPPEATVVDMGAGTGTLTTAIAVARPDCRVIGIDGDRTALEIARAKPGGDRVQWQHGLVDDTQFEPPAADAVLMSLLLHHLERDAKLRALRHAHRALRDNGQLFIADWGRPQGPAMRLAFSALRLIDGRSPTADHAAGRLPAIIRSAGFRAPLLRQRLPTLWGTLEIDDTTPLARVTQA